LLKLVASVPSLYPALAGFDTNTSRSFPARHCYSDPHGGIPQHRSVVPLASNILLSIRAGCREYSSTRVLHPFSPARMYSNGSIFLNLSAGRCSQSHLPSTAQNGLRRNPAGKVRGKELQIHPVHTVEIVKIEEMNAHFDDAARLFARSFKDPLHVGKFQAGLRFMSPSSSSRVAALKGACAATKLNPPATTSCE
jgi:hypothetical protein